MAGETSGAYGRPMAAEDAIERQLAHWRPRSWGRRQIEEARHLLSSRAGRLLVGAVGAIALLTAIGLIALWPYGWKAPGGAALVGTIPAKVTRVIDKPCAPPDPEVCRSIVASVEGREVTMGVTLKRHAPSLEPGDAIRVRRPGPTNVAPPANQSVHYDFAEMDRRGSLLWLGVIAAVLAAVLLRWRGILAVLGVALSIGTVVWFLVPAILAGRPPLLVALVAALIVMFVTLVLTNGVGAQTMAAALGVSATLVLTCLLAAFAVGFAHLNGATDQALLGIAAQNHAISLPGIMLAAILIGALGVLADTAVTQASAVMALRRANPLLGARALYREAFVIGRDHLSATIHTLVLAYVGAALPLLLTLRAVQVPTTDVLNNQSVAEPIVATLVGCVALLAAVPLATGLASLLVARLPVDVLPDVHHHH
jgi:uncharacterized membrane protein